MKNLALAQILYEIADLLELQEEKFKPQAYRNAARSIETLSEDIEKIYQEGKLEEIPGVGEHIAQRIQEFIETGKISYHSKLKKQIGIDIEQLMRIPNLGPKRIKTLHQKLNIKNINDLEKALKAGKVSKLQGFGEETEKHLLKGLEQIKANPQRWPYAQALPLVNEIIAYFKKSSFVEKIEVAGSFRRGKETIGDLDFLVVSKHPDKIAELFTKMPDVKEVLASGKTKISVLLNSNIQVDLRIVTEKEFGSALLYFIGNKEHNIEIRKLALSKGYTLSEYGLFKLKDKSWVAGRTEQEIYDKLGLNYIEPELRENMGEIQASQQDKLPSLINLKDIQGIFHNHSDWSDGSNTLLEMAKKAQSLGLKFISFNDHYSRLGIINHLNEKRLDAYLKAIDKVRKQVKIKVFSGIEIDIQKDGTLDLPISKLKKLDVVVASVHTSLDMPDAEMTKRICYALENYPINILGHPTSVEIGSRASINVNLKKVFETAKKNNVFLETNASPRRMDLSGYNIKSALDAGCKVVIGTDGHSTDQLENSYLGILCARRGWAEKKDVLNCWDVKKIETALKK
jgi:DNA polymerase (family 10)